STFLTIFLFENYLSLQKRNLMYTTLQANIDELDNSFLQKIKELFKHQKVTITIQSEMDDDTEYLLSNPNNKKRIIESVEQAKNGQTILLNIDDLK
ncbi:MAG: hypothetical protein RIQ33_226, partial [Bacteroidota bacterium]